MTSGSDVRLIQRLETSGSSTPLDPISGKCSIAFQSRPDIVHHLKHANPVSTNVYTAHFKLDGRLWLWQQIVPGPDSKNGKSWLRRTIIYEAKQIITAKVEPNPASPLTSYRLQIEVSGPPVSSFESTTMAQKDIQEKDFNTENFPIHVKSQTEDWKCLTIVTESKGMLKNFTITNATALLLDSGCYHQSVNQGRWIKEQYDAVAAEADYLRNKTLSFKNVTAELVREMKFILVKIKFASIGEAALIDESFVSNNLALRYEVEGPPNSVLSSACVDDYSTRTGREGIFTGAVVDYATHADCVLQLRLLHEIPEHKLDLFDKKRITGVNLSPIPHDSTRNEADLAHSQLTSIFNKEEAHEFFTLFSDPLPAESSLEVGSRVSARRLFLPWELPLIDRDFDDGSKRRDWANPIRWENLRRRQDLASWNRLDVWQQAAIEASDEFPLSIIEGPAGTGKTLTIAAFLACRMTSNPRDCVMICAPRNVAVQKLVQDTVAVMQRDNLQDLTNEVFPLPLVHAESEAIIDARYLSAQPPKDRYHIQTLRIRLAKKLENINFTIGVRLLERDGYIGDTQQWSRYKAAREELTYVLMRNIRMIFVTTSSARGTFLRALKFLPDILVIDECGCAKPQDIAIPMMAIGGSLTRMILAGDSRQFLPLVFTKLAQKTWKVTLFAELMGRGHTTTRLNIEYRSHSSLYQPTSRVFYEGTVQSYHGTVHDSPPMLNILTENLPRAILVDDTTIFRLSGFTHFLDVPEGKCVYSPGGSSQNELEATVAVNLARGLLAAIPGVTQRDIMILSGYARQVKLIQGLALECRLYDVLVKTVDGLQGDEAQIVILSTVRDGGDLGFMQSASRANVATSRQKTALYIVGN